MRNSLEGRTYSNTAGRNAEWLNRRKHAGYLLSGTALLALMGFGIATYWVRETKLSTVDLEVTTKFQSFQNARFYRLMLLVSSLGYAPTVQQLLIAAVSILWLSGRKLESLFTFASAGATAIVVMVKMLVGRPRPAGKAIRISMKLPDYGFPSGHTVHYVSFYGFLAYLAATRLKLALLRKATVTAIAFLIALVGPSRIYLGQHWLSDVMAAYLLGFAYLVGLTNEYERLRATRSRSQNK